MHIVIDTPGTSLRMRDGLLSIKRDEDIKRVPLNKIESLSLTRGVMLSSDVLSQCLDNGIDLLIIEPDGKPAGRLWNHRFGSISSIRKAQLEFARGKEATRWVISQLQYKFRQQKALLETFYQLPDALIRQLQAACGHLEQMGQKLNEYTGLNLQEAASRIRAVEGQAGKKYFEVINQHLPHRYRFARRSQHPAEDGTNALLNYAYGILYGLIESALIKAGLDPFIGILHRDEYNRPVLTYDCIEPFRPWADWVVFHLLFNEIMDESFFEHPREGGVWLRREGKRYLIQHFYDFFEEVIFWEGQRLSRINHLQSYCHQLAGRLIGK